MVVKLKAVRCPRCGKKHGEGLDGTAVFICIECGCAFQIRRRDGREATRIDGNLMSVLST